MFFTRLASPSTSTSTSYEAVPTTSTATATATSPPASSSSSSSSLSSTTSTSACTPTQVHRIAIASSSEIQTRRLNPPSASADMNIPSPSVREGLIRRSPFDRERMRIKPRVRLPSLPYQQMPASQQPSAYSSNYVFPTPPSTPSLRPNTPATPLSAYRQTAEYEEWSIYETYLKDPEYQKKLKKRLESRWYDISSLLTSSRSRDRCIQVTAYVLFIVALLIAAHALYTHRPSNSSDLPFRPPVVSPAAVPASSSSSLPSTSTHQSPITTPIISNGSGPQSDPSLDHHTPHDTDAGADIAAAHAYVQNPSQGNEEKGLTTAAAADSLR